MTLQIRSDEDRSDSGPVEDRLRRVAAAWARHVGAPEDARLELSEGQPITSGSQAAAISRYRLQAKHDDRRWDAEVVLKDTWLAELVCLREIAGRQHRPDPLPALLDGDLLPAGDLEADHPLRSSWVAVPSYDGVPLALGQPLPLDLAEALAWLHAEFLGSTSGIRSVIGIDFDWFRRSLIREFLLPQWAFYSHADTATEVRDWLTELAAEPLVEAALEGLPRTLLHGDVHNGNIVVDKAGRSGLIDWANARLGPPMLDLANVTDWDSPALKVYGRAFERASGVRDRHLIEVEFTYAKLQINTQYLGPFLVPEGARAMIGRARAARDHLRSLLT